MAYTSIEIIIKLHQIAIDMADSDEQALRNAIRDRATLQFICTEANKLDEPIERAAHLLQKIAIWHPFYEANKRTALLAAEDTLLDYGLQLTVNPSKDNEFIRMVAADKVSQE